MAKKKSKLYKVNTENFKPNEVMLYGSSNGWLKMINADGDEVFLVPDQHTDKDEPVAWCMIGKYSEMEADNADNHKQL
jgi:hypothetical protein